MGRAESSWRVPPNPATLAAAIDQGRAVVLAAHLEPVLTWLASADAATPIGRALSRRGIDAAQGRRRALALLETLLFGSGDEPARVLALAPGASADVLRRRYRLLMRVYHPDVHDEDPAWLTERSERIIRAYAEARRSRPVRRPARPVAMRVRHRSGRRRRARGLRFALGRPAVFRRRFVASVLAGCVVLLIHTCVSERTWHVASYETAGTWTAEP